MHASVLVESSKCVLMNIKLEKVYIMRPTLIPL